MKRIKFLLAAFAVALVATFVDQSGIFGSSVLGLVCGALSLKGCGAALAFAAVTVGNETDQPISTDAPGASVYLEDDLDRDIVKVRPSDTPLDTMTREVRNVRKCMSWEAGGAEIGVREIIDATNLSNDTSEAASVNIVVANVDMWRKGDTLTIVDPTAGPVASGVVTAITEASDTITVKITNASNASAKIPALDADIDYELMLMAKGVNELTSKVDGFNIDPVTRSYYNQIHMAVVEESVIHALHNKKYNADFAVYKEQTLYQFRRGMELTNWFQHGGKGTDQDGKTVYYATGIWHQADKTASYDTDEALTDANWATLCRYFFSGNNGSDSRVLFAGDGLLEKICAVPSYAKQLEAKKSELVLGVRVNRIETAWGQLLVKPMSSIFNGYYENCGFVADLNYITRNVFEPLQTKSLNLDDAGISRVKDCVRILETSSLYLENLPVHCRIIPGSAVATDVD